MPAEIQEGSPEVWVISIFRYPSGKFGDQKIHQAENNLGGEGLKKAVEEFL